MTAVGGDGVTIITTKNIVRRIPCGDNVASTVGVISCADLNQSAILIEQSVSVVAYRNVSTVIRTTINRVPGGSTKYSVWPIGSVNEILGAIFRGSGANLTNDAAGVQRIVVKDCLTTVTKDVIGSGVTFNSDALTGVVDEVSSKASDHDISTATDDDLVTAA